MQFCLDTTRLELHLDPPSSRLSNARYAPALDGPATNTHTVSTGLISASSEPMQPVGKMSDNKMADGMRAGARNRSANQM
jgi:hypothetical protein